MAHNLMVGAMIDNDNAPAPENIPTANENTDGSFCQWEHSGTCYRALAGGCRLKARISYLPNIKPSLFNMFVLFFFMLFVCEGCHYAQNQHVSNSKWGTSQAFLWGVFAVDWYLVANVNAPWSGPCDILVFVGDQPFSRSTVASD